MSWLSDIFGGGGKTKTTSTNAINYDPTALNWYGSNLNTAFPTLQSLASNPFGNPFFQANLGMMNKQALAAGQTQMNNITQRLSGSGLTDRSGLGQNLLLRAGMGTSALQQAGRFSAMNQANTQQMQALQGLAGFQPLLTGSSGTSTSQQSSSIIPQLLSAGLAFGMGFANPSSGYSPAQTSVGIGNLPLYRPTSASGMAGVNTNAGWWGNSTLPGAPPPVPAPSPFLLNWQF